MGLLEKAGNIKTIEKEPVQTKSAMDKEAAAYDAKVAKSIPTPKAAKVAKSVKVAKPAKVKKVKKSKEPKAARVRKDRVLKSIPEGFAEVGRARSTGLWLIDSIVNWGLLLTIVLAIGFYDGDFTYLLVGCILICISNLVLMPLWTTKTIGNWVTSTQYINTRGKTPMFLFHVMKNLKIPMNLTGLILILVWLPVVLGTADPPSVVATIFGVSFFIMSLADTFSKRFNHQKFGLWEFSFGGIWLVKSTSESTGGNKFLKRLESLSDYSESKGWLEDKDEDA